MANFKAVVLQYLIASVSSPVVAFKFYISYA